MSSSSGLRSCGDFLELLDLHEATLANVDLELLFRNVYEWVAVIWSRTTMYKFVDHGINHSYADLEKALQISTGLGRRLCEFEPLERCVLGMAALLHDIGMQYGKYAGEEMSAQEIRKNHCELGFQMVEAAREGTFEADLGGPALQIDKQTWSFVYFASVVGFAHSGSKHWKALDESDYGDRKEGGQQLLRLRYLAALLRIADEVHTEYTRLLETSFMTSPLLDEKGKAHWAACYYTQDVEVSSPVVGGGGGVYLTMKWRVPRVASDETVDVIRTLLQDLREKKTNTECQLVRKYLRLSEHSDPCFIEFRLEPTPQRSAIEDPSADVVMYVREMRPIHFGLSEPSQLGNLSFLPQTSEDDGWLRTHAEQFFSQGRGVISGHFRVRTGRHTNKYVRCRELCEDSGFSFKLAWRLASFYRDREIAHVIAVGTSAIRVTSLLSVMLPGVEFSYTFADERSYTTYEQDIKRVAGNVLIVDDILGVGSVLHQVVDRLRSQDPIPMRIEAFVLYSLGDAKAALADLVDVEVTCLAAFPDVMYWDEVADGTCPQCAPKPGILSLPE
ncbi:MAG: hypothetical protein Q7W51_08355 [Coriobacteriia bacterium]|nr:hypothetical protein [Coriobacteriia bacterium]